jgi:hypothetical protein
MWRVDFRSAKRIRFFLTKSPTYCLYKIKCEYLTQKAKLFMTVSSKFPNDHF